MDSKKIEVGQPKAEKPQQRPQQPIGLYFTPCQHGCSHFAPTPDESIRAAIQCQEGMFSLARS